ncbi:TPA: hypothetical protein ACH3X2_009427 [Trebouxia sp. C0005]
MSNEGMSVMVGDLSHEDPATLSRLPFGHSQMSSFSRGGWTLACRIWSMMLEDLDPTSKQQASSDQSWQSHRRGGIAILVGKQGAL